MQKRTKLRTRASALLVAIMTMAAVGLMSVPAGAAPSGSISGRVLDGGGAPIQGICVGVDAFPPVTTDLTGAYSATGIAAGTHTVSYVDCNPSPVYASQWFNGQTTQQDATPVPVTDGIDTLLADTTLAAGIAVSGTVTDGNGAPLPNANINVNPVGGGQSSGTTSAPDGTYTTGLLPAGTYRVQFSSADPQWAPEYWNDKLTWSTADDLVLATSDGPVHTGIDAQLTASTTIQGTVTGAGGAPLNGICVDASVPNGNGGFDPVNSASTDLNGAYSLGALPAADLRVHFRDCSTGVYVEQWYNGQSDANSSTPIVLPPGAVQTGVDAQLIEGVKVGGHVTDGNGAPIPNINVNVQPTNGGPSGYAQTDSNGDYLTNAVAGGDYQVQFQGTPQYAGEWWNDKLVRNLSDALTLSSGDGPVRGGVDAQLAAAAGVSGTVTNANGQPIANICVDSVIDTPSGFDGLGSATTAPDGTYTISGLPVATVKVVFRDCNNVGPYATQWFDGKDGADAATPVVLTAGSVHAGIDTQLAAAGSISGHVTDTNGDPVSSICAQATTDSFVGGQANTDSNGNYTIVLGRPGNYRVQFFDCDGPVTYASQWWNAQSSMAAAQLVPITTGSTVTGIDAVMAPGTAGSISGRVVTTRGTAMTTACVLAYAPPGFVRFGLIQPDGTYTIPDVPSATFAVAFVGCGSGDPTPWIDDPDVPGVSYLAQWWKGVPLDITNQGDGGPDPIAQGATLVSLQPGQNLTGYDMCFGCGSIVISSITPGPNSLTVAFTTPELDAAAQFAGAAGAAAAAAAPPAITYTVRCVSPTGVSGTATGPASPITVTGLTAGASYTCAVTADAGGSLVATSAVLGATVTAVPFSGSGGRNPASAGVTGSLPRTGSSSPVPLAKAGALLLVLGLGLVGLQRRRNRHGLLP